MRGLHGDGGAMEAVLEGCGDVVVEQRVGLGVGMGGVLL